MKWISVKERLPDDHELVLVMYFDGTGPAIDSVGERNFVTAVGEDITYKVWNDYTKQVSIWCHIPKISYDVEFIK